MTTYSVIAANGLNGPILVDDIGGGNGQLMANVTLISQFESVVPPEGVIAMTLPPLVFDAAGNVAFSAIFTVLPPLVFDAAGNVDNTAYGTISMTLPPIEMAASGFVIQNVGIADMTLPDIIMEAAGHMVNPVYITGELILPPLTMALLGNIRVPIQGGGEPDFFVAVPNRNFRTPVPQRHFVVDDVNRAFRIRQRT